MQIQILKPDENGKHFPDYDQMIANARDEDERNYLIGIKKRNAEWAAKGYPDEGFAFGIIYTSKMACGHYEIFQHPIYCKWGDDPTDNDILESIADVVATIKETKKDHMKCTRCICNFM